MLFKNKSLKHEKAYSLGEIFLISIIKLDNNTYNIKYVLKNYVDMQEYKGYLYFDFNTDNCDLIYELKHKASFGKWLLCEFDYYNVLLCLHN